jgi:hypothetical protein
MSIEVVKQESLRTECYTKNGEEKEVHVVVKKLPFVLKIQGRHVNLHEALTARVLLDAPGEKEVGFIASSPLEYIARVSTNGESATVEVRLSCLTSQHEGNLFRLRFSTGTCWCDTQPIKVISKVGTSLPKEPKTLGGGTKNTVNKAVLQQLARIEEAQKKLAAQNSQQLSLLENLSRQGLSVGHLMLMPDSAPLSPGAETPLDTPQHKKQRTDSKRANAKTAALALLPESYDNDSAECIAQARAQCLPEQRNKRLNPEEILSSGLSKVAQAYAAMPTASRTATLRSIVDSLPDETRLLFDLVLRDLAPNTSPISESPEMPSEPFSEPDLAYDTFAYGFPTTFDPLETF